MNATRNQSGILFSEVSGGRFEPNDDAWRAFATQLGYVFSPKLARPAETLGHAGLSIGALWSGTMVSGSEPYWAVTERGQRTGSGAGLLNTLQLEVRKGLPFSFEVGANLMWLVDSELLAPGLEVRWALQEGYRYIPDFSVSGSVNHMVGNRDMMLTTVGVDLSLSKSFGLFGTVNFAPYATWSFLLIAASSHVIDPTPTLDTDPDQNFIFRTMSPGSAVHHKLTLGGRALFSVLSLAVQGEFEMFNGEKVFGPVASITTRLGLDF